MGYIHCGSRRCIIFIIHCKYIFEAQGTSINSSSRFDHFFIFFIFFLVINWYSYTIITDMRQEWSLKNCILNKERVMYALKQITFSLGGEETRVDPWTSTFFAWCSFKCVIVEEGGAEEDNIQTVSSGTGGELLLWLPSFFFNVMAIILQVRFSSLDPLGKVSFALVYSLHTCVANGSSFLSSSFTNFLGGNNESDNKIEDAAFWWWSIILV